MLPSFRNAFCQLVRVTPTLTKIGQVLHICQGAMFAITWFASHVQITPYPIWPPPCTSTQFEFSPRFLYQMVPKRHHDCIIHQESVCGETVKAFSAVRWEKFHQCAEKWMNLDGIERSLAETARQNEHLAQSCDEIPQDVGFHETCCRRFIDSKNQSSWKMVQPEGTATGERGWSFWRRRKCMLWRAITKEVAFIIQDDKANLQL